MIRVALVLCLIAAPSMAQAPPPDPAAMGQVLMGCVGREVQAITRINQLEAEIAKMKVTPPEDKKP